MSDQAAHVRTDDHPSGGTKKVVFASSLGTVFEWYDFYLYGSLAAVISRQFFSGVNETTAFIFALLAFAAGFAVRPFGALVFGRVGDLVGRKYTFLITIVIMGGATFAVGLLPSYESIGVAAPIILIVLRLLQGLALGGEYGGAAVYVAEHAPPDKRGLHTSWIQTTATLGLFLSLIVILLVRHLTGPEFDTWGWRIPFLVSAVLLAISVWIRLKLDESPVFRRMKAEGRSAKAPIKESFGNWANGRLVLIALFGAVAGQAVIWYAGQFYALFFLTQTLKVDATTANYLMAGALVLGTPFFIVFGALSDKIGRKPILLAGFALAIATYFPIFEALTRYGNPALAAAREHVSVVVSADPRTCTFQFNPVGTSTFESECDQARAALSRASVAFTTESAPSGASTRVTINEVEFGAFDAAALIEATREAGYPAAADPADLRWIPVLLLLTVLVVYATMVYGPIAALLVEMFPARIRYTSMSLPYHIGNGWFGGFLPSVSFALVAATGDIYYGLWYPIVIALFSLVCGAVFVRETKGQALE